MTVTRQLVTANASHGQSTVALSHNRDVHIDGAHIISVDYTARCPRQWFNSRELAIDVALGQLGLVRPYHGRLYDPAIEAMRSARPDICLLYEGHYMTSTLPRWRRAAGSTEIVLYVHNPISRTHRRFELNRLLSAADRVVFCSDHLRRTTLSRLGGKSPVPFSTVHNGVAEQFFEVSRGSNKRSDFTILYFGRVEAGKGVHFILEAVAKAQRGRSEVLPVRIVGGAHYDAGQTGLPYERMLKQRAETLGVSTTFVPHLPPEGLIEELGMASVVCLPSTHSEGFPLSILEAMAAGLPVICSDSPGMVEAGGNAAIVTPQRDVAALSRAISLLADSPCEWQRRSIASLERARKFSWASTLGGILNRDDPTAGLATAAP